MDLSDALGDWPNSNQNSGGGTMWPGQPSNNSGWPGGPTQPVWPGPSPNQPSQPVWPGPSPNQPSQPSWPGPSPNQPSQPSWPGPSPNQPSQPVWPGPSPNQPSQPSWPGPSPHQPSQPSHPSHPSAPQQNLKIPYSHSLPQGLQDKKLITITGLVKHSPKKFMVDFCAGKDIVFHFNPRFNEGGKQVIVRNSELGKRWGTEERGLSRFPFAAGKSFEIKILVTSTEFRVAVDGGHLLEFKHRMPNLRAINSVHVFEDVTLTKFTVEDLR